MKLIAGNCVLESRETALETAITLSNIADKLGLDYYFKASFNKSNRTSGNSFRGIGFDECMDIFDEISAVYGIRTATDIHESHQAGLVADHIDLIQIPAMLSRQTDLIKAAADTGRIVNIKKSQGADPYSMEHAIKKAEGASEIFITERGTTFGYNNLIVDMRSLEIMKSLGVPIIFDATHSVQLPSAANGISGGQREFVDPLARAAAAVGVNGFFLETHPDPDNALSDGPNSVPLHEMKDLLIQLMRIHDAVI